MIAVKLQGGLGNQMFQYAVGKALAKRLKTKLFLDHFFLEETKESADFVRRKFALDLFPIKAEKLPIKYRNKFFGELNLIEATLSKMSPACRYSVIKEPFFSFFQPIFNYKGNLYLDGYWQSPLYFDNISSEIRCDFDFLANVDPKPSLKYLDDIKKNESVLIHVRRTDYLYTKSVKLLGDFKGVEYINNGLQALHKFLINPTFYIFSDDIPWCRENIKLENAVFIDQEVEGLSLQSYFQLMCSCRHFIIPNSTFSWWAAWLGNFPGKKVVAPEKWFATEEIEILPKEWIKI